MNYKTLREVDHVTFTPNQVPLGQKTTVLVTVDKGFKIDKLNLIDMNDYGGEIDYSTYKDGKLTIDFTGIPDETAQGTYFDSNIVDDPNIKLNATLPKVPHVTFIPNEIPVGTITTVKAVADFGYKINSINIYIENSWTYERTLDANYKDGSIIFDLTSFTNDNAASLKDAKQAVDIVKYTPIVYNLPTADNVTFTPKQAVLGTITKITINPDKDYTFVSGKGLVLDNGTALGGFQGLNTYNLDLTNYTGIDQLKTAHWDLKYAKAVKQIPLKLNLTNCTSDTVSIPENTTKTVTLKANNGYYFDDDVVIYSYNNSFSEPDDYSIGLIKANKQATITVKMQVGSDDNYQQAIKNKSFIPTITAKATKPNAIPTGTQSMNIYNMSDGEIDTFMNSMVETWGTDDIESVNFTEYVNQIYRIPFNIPQEDTKNITSIKVGKYYVPVNTEKVNKDKLIIDCGTIDVKPHYNNSNDYNPLACVLYLPFTKEVSLNINDIINHSINIKYNVDLLNGETTVVVSTEDNEIYTNQFNISTSLEYYGLYEDTIVGRLNSTYINGIMQAYLRLIYNKPVNNLVSYETNEHGTLKDYHGFTKISNINLQYNYEYNDLDEIKSLLEQGIIIK